MTFAITWAGIGIWVGAYYLGRIAVALEARR
jgi:hypothetical protein